MIGTFDVTVKNTYGQRQTLGNALQFVDTPGFASTAPVTPASATINSSALIRINGVRFVVGADASSSSTVVIGDTPCTVDVGQSTSTTLFCTLANTHSTVQTADVVVTNPSGSVATLSNGFKFQLPPPVISGITPNSGFASQTTDVTIAGTGFQQGAQVAIVNSSYACANVTVAVDGTSITCTVPSNRIGPANVVITNPDAQTDVDSGGFAYLPPNPVISSIAPATGSIAGGTSITVTGTGFVAGAAVSVGGQACANVGVVSPLSLTCVTPAGSQGGAEVVVTNPNGQAGSRSASDAAFSYVIPAPDVTSILPVAGDISGGTTMTINGANLLPTTAVNVGDNACTNIAVAQSGDSLTCTVPAGSAGAADVAVANDTLSTTVAGGFTYGNANHVFWTDGSAGNLGQAEYGGANVDSDLLSGLSTPAGMASDGTYLYWINGNSIGRADLNGRERESGFHHRIASRFSIRIGSRCERHLLVESHHSGHLQGTAHRRCDGQRIRDARRRIRADGHRSRCHEHLLGRLVSDPDRSSTAGESGQCEHQLRQRFQRLECVQRARSHGRVRRESVLGEPRRRQHWLGAVDRSGHGYSAHHLHRWSPGRYRCQWPIVVLDRRRRRQRHHSSES
ncbi:MAG: IPT/TIG domain-containing protein [Sporocytophaga sp.]|nr:IPT/TIG domain-containing protein [Sporocytophaga sp.]